MFSKRALALVVASALLPGCTSGLAFTVANRAMKDQQAAESYRGRYVERLGVDPETGKEQVVVREVVYQKPGKVRIEVVEPEERRGELVLYDGSTMILWRAHDRFGIRVRGATPPSFKQLRALVYEDVRWTWDNYHTFYRGKQKQAGRTAHVWRSYPKGDRPLYRYEAWLDEDYAIPLKTWIRDTRVHTWYSMEFQEIAVNVPVGESEFTFNFPEDAVVADWDLAAPASSREELQKSLNFELRLPEELPADLKVEKIVRAAPGTPAAVVVMRNKARVVTLGQMPSLGRMLDLGPGLPIKLNDAETARLNLLGNFTSINWYAGNTAMFMVGNLPYPQMIEMARKLTPEDKKVQRDQGLLSLKSYRGRYVEECAGREPSRVVREVLFEAPAKLRVEVKEPADHAGEVVVYDGSTLSTWSPQQAVGLRVGGRPPPQLAETRQRLKERGLWNLRNFQSSYVRSEDVAGRRADLWRSVSKRPEPYQLSSEAWLDAETAFPLRSDLKDRDGRPLCSVRFESIAFDAESPPGAFSLELPKDAVVFDQDLSGPGVSAQDLEARCGFDFLMPAAGPSDRYKRRLFPGAQGGPVGTLLMEDGASWLSLTEVRHFASAPKSWTSIPISVGNRPGTLDMIGDVNTIAWSIGNVSLTLIGNLPLSEMVKVAASVEPRAGGQVLGRYRGRFVERAAGLPPVVREVSFEAPYKLNVRVVEPKSRAGERVVYDGDSLHMWWPQQLFGASVGGAPSPSDDDARDALAKSGLWALHNYQVRYAGTDTIVGRAADRYELVPSREAPFVHPTTIWFDQATSLPLKSEMRDRPDHVWYSVEFEQLDLEAPADESSFKLAFPANAVKFDFNLGDPDRRPEELQGVLNFKLLLPASLPDGMKITRVVKGRHELPMAVVVARDRARWMTLTEVRRAIRTLDKETGIPVPVGSNQGYLNMLGGFSSVTWLQGDAALTLVGNLPLPELMQAASSVGERTGK